MWVKSFIETGGELDPFTQTPRNDAAVVSERVMDGSQDLCWRLVSLSEIHKFHNPFWGENKCQGILMLQSGRTN